MDIEIQESKRTFNYLNTKRPLRYIILKLSKPMIKKEFLRKPEKKRQ